MSKPVKPAKRLITEYENYDDETLMDHLSILARDLEDAMIQCGGQPDKDYTFLDVFKLAVQLEAGRKKKK